MKDLILSIDQGTTGTTVMLIDRELQILTKKNNEFPQHYPQIGWVEHDPEEIWNCTIKTIHETLSEGPIDVGRIAGIGITNQRETTVLWDRSNSQAIHNAIVWQDRRTASFCEKLKKKGLEKKFKKKTGLLLDPYFSGTKLRWLLDNIPGARERTKQEEIAFGTIDTYLTWRLTGGDAHVTDPSNASRTLLMNLASLQWDPELMKVLNIPSSVLPKIASSSEIYGTTKNVPGIPDGIPIAGIAGDQQAALFGQACFGAGEAKCTYGTGSFILLNTGKKIVQSRNKLLTTVAWKLNGETHYALEGSAFIAGAAVQWLRDGLKMISSAVEIEELAGSTPDSHGVIFVPALVGLGAPYWNAEARGTLSGLTRATTRAHIARATLEGIAFLQYDILEAMTKDLGKKLKILKVDGGASANNLLMQFQSDILGVPLSRPKMIETTALGAAFLAGLATGVWESTQVIREHWQEDRKFTPQLTKSQIKNRVEAWHSAVKKA
jgi:glycerol kinase